MTISGAKDKWTETIERLSSAGRLTSHQCVVYTKTSVVVTGDEKCGCQRPVRHHSFDGVFSETRPHPDDWNVKEHTAKLRQLIYHSTPSRKFLRCACENRDDIATLYELMTSVCSKPKLIISVYGGRKHFTMSEDIEKEFMDSLAEAAVTSGTWIITSGLNNGAARLIGEGVDRLRALTDTKQSTTLLGISWWGNVTRKTREMVSNLQRGNLMSNKDQMNMNTSFFFDDKDERSLEKNHTHFLLLDDGKYQSSSSYDETNMRSMTVINQPSDSDEQTQDRHRANSDNGYMPRTPFNGRPFTFGTTTKYPKEMQRVDFVDYACEKDKSYAVTIIVEGGINTCLAVLNDIQMKRPVIFIQGSGKIADVIASLLDLTAKNDYTPARLPEQDEIEHNLRRFPMRTRTEKEHRKLIEQIREIMHPDGRRYLTVFRINSELDLKQTICHAIFKAHFAQTNLYRTDTRNDAPQRRDDKSKKKNLLELAIKWDCFDQATELLAELQYRDLPKLSAELFQQALVEDRPAFVDYFLRTNYDPRRTLNLIENERPDSFGRNDSRIPLDSDSTLNTNNIRPKDFIAEYQNQTKLSRQGLKFIFQLYKNAANSNMRNSTRKSGLCLNQPQSEGQLNAYYRTWIGNFICSVPIVPSDFYLHTDSDTKASCHCEWICSCRTPTEVDDPYSNLNEALLTFPAAPLISSSLYEKMSDGTLTKKLIQAMLRDLLYWSIFTDRIDMAKILILHLRTRICAALSCAAILRNRASRAITSDQGHFYKQQANDFEMYATDCINACYSRSERKACELLMHQELLFGKITCMQVAIASHSRHFINTDCFSQVLNRIWYKKLSRTDKTVLWNLKFVISFLTVGLLAPCTMPYCPAEDVEENKQSENVQNDIEEKHNSVHELTNTSSTSGETFLSSQLSSAGVNYYTRYRKSSNFTWHNYVDKFKDFHRCPMVKMCYHFVGYIWLLLVFSYMVLFKLVPPNETGHTLHWTEFYIIITISTMVIEEIRRSIFYYITNMREGQQKSWLMRLILAFLKGAPYSLFFAGITLWYASANAPSVFTTAKIILAIDLELWYIWSLKFITVIKTLSPKVFMMGNMLRDLFGFLYVAIICIAAYGVASRAMIMQDELSFTPRSIFGNIFYAPYWFLYADAEEERKTLNEIITRNNSRDLNTEAGVTHVLLAFHMLLFNILLINLLIAVFATTISKVENNAKYLYHYQRYIITQEYFEKPIMPVPPLILIWYISMIVRYIWHRLIRRCRTENRVEKNEYHVTKIFKMIPIDPQFTEKCTAFEHAATYDYARRVVEDKKGKRLT